ncbi:MAG: GNAT family N-acetyltransferase [Bacteroidota bacterium]
MNKISWVAKSHWGYPDDWMERWKPDLELHKEDLSKQEILVLLDGAQAIGFSAVQDYSEHVEVNHLWILPSYIGKGLGKRLLQKSLTKALVKGRPVLVDADPNAEGFYTNFGFITFAQVASYPPGRFLPRMRLFPTLDA